MYMLSKALLSFFHIILQCAPDEEVDDDDDEGDLS